MFVARSVKISRCRPNDHRIGGAPARVGPRSVEADRIDRAKREPDHVVDVGACQRGDGRDLADRAGRPVRDADSGAGDPVPGGDHGDRPGVGPGCAAGSRSTAASGSSLIACWAMMRFNMTVFFVALGVYVIIAALMRPQSLPETVRRSDLGVRPPAAEGEGAHDHDEGVAAAGVLVPDRGVVPSGGGDAASG